MIMLWCVFFLSFSSLSLCFFSFFAYAFSFCVALSSWFLCLLLLFHVLLLYAAWKVKSYPLLLVLWQNLSFTVWHWPLLLPTCMLHVAVEGLSACMWLLLLLFKPALSCFQKKLLGFNVSSLLICCQIWNLYNLIVLLSLHKQGEVLSTYEDFFCMIAMDTEPDCFAATFCRLVLGNVTTTQLSLRTPFCRSWLVVIGIDIYCLYSLTKR